METTLELPFPAQLSDPSRIRAAYLRMAKVALEEDFGDGADVSTLATVPADATGTKVMRARQSGVISGLEALTIVAEVAADRHIDITPLVADGDRVDAGADIARVEGTIQHILMLERTLLNILSHASGIATQTRAWVDVVAATASSPGGCLVRDSRKTLPGMRMLEKRAVVHGGGYPHRYNLGDQVMVKDNHVELSNAAEAYARVRDFLGDDATTWVEVEVDTLEQLSDLLGADRPHPPQVLLDNFSVEDTKKAVELRDNRAPEVLLESSGGLTLDVVADYAAAGVDSVAVGGLTHSVRALDIGLD
ncbi:carboxylating nicotinate-nucleotide diphosphorylase [uncultured Corynebacterium sp.]|uniref:carboxylating nicotinate-nucleotide diphosphorylase n=1 Tax=uncultured Corynebacterium sp. TaxID=159447 RepID=UPI0025E328E8|nr:carboxylating nicotinate-nucleotide diphosphorylase [uncultured Corynebacterium sp.]